MRQGFDIDGFRAAVLQRLLLEKLGMHEWQSNRQQARSSILLTRGLWLVKQRILLKLLQLLFWRLLEVRCEKFL